MDNWLKILMPVLAVILIVVAAVSITLAVTTGNTAKQIVSASYTQPGTPDSRLAQGPACPSCPGFGKVTDNETGSQGTVPGYANGGNPGSCCANYFQNNSVPRGGYTGGSCCDGR